MPTMTPSFSFKDLALRTYQHLRHDVIRFSSKRSLARLLSTCLCCIIIVIRPFSALGGSVAFLVLAIKELVFSVQSSLAQQLELTVLNILGALLGIAFSTLGKFIASRTPSSARARATCATFLIVISFFAGLTRSRLPRLLASTRISCFVSVWILTADIGDRSRVLTLSGNFLWITLSAAIICLFSLLFVMSLIRWTSTNFERDIAETFSVIHRGIDMGLNLAFPHPGRGHVDRNEYEQLKVDLLQRSIRLNENYSQAAFELRIGRLSLRSIRPLISTVEHMRRELAWGMPLKDPVMLSRRSTMRNMRTRPSSPIALRPNKYSNSLEQPARALGNALMDCITCVERTVTLAFHQTDPPPRLFSWRPGSSPTSSPTASPRSDAEKGEPRGWTLSQLSSLKAAEEALRVAKDDARDELKLVFNDIDSRQRDADADPDVSQDALHCSLAMIALLQMAQEIKCAVQVAENFTICYESSRARLWFPRVSLSWLGVPPGSFVYDDPVAAHSVYTSPSDDALASIDDHSKSPEWKQGLREAHSIHVRRAALKAARLSMSSKEGDSDKRLGCGWIGWIIGWLYDVWSSRRTLMIRLRLWKFLKAVSHSSHLRHALKNACGVALLTFPAFMTEDTSGRRWYTEDHGQWLTISFLWVLETNTGATWRTGYLRIVGTAIGALYAYITYLICHTNPYGLVVMVTAADIPITWLITQNNLGLLAVPLSVAIPPIAFARFIEPDLTQPIVDTALLRAGLISAGMVAALLMNAIVFPRHCRVYFLSDTSRTIGLLTDLYLTLSHNIWHEKNAFTRDDRQKTLKLELEVRNALQRLSVMVTTMHHEVGLLPKPLRHYRRVVNVLQNLLDILTGLRKIRENIPRKATVSEVFHERREFMSCVCVALFSCQHAFKAREPLPQFLPSARHALSSLETKVRERLREARDSDPQAMGLSLVYSFAEQEVLGGMVDAMEKLLEVTGSLFGASAWLTSDTQWSRATVREEGNRGWYSTTKWEEDTEIV